MGQDIGKRFKWMSRYIYWRGMILEHNNLKNKSFLKKILVSMSLKSLFLFSKLLYCISLL
jgi:hypothetical protein